MKKIFLLGKFVKVFMETEEIDKLEIALYDLHNSIKSSSPFDPKIATRIYSALAKGSKFIAIYYAQKANSENQELKARNI
ncbi:MAG: hypothetical protein ABH971_01535 [bacterium]